jgi:hypothetical protein
MLDKLFSLHHNNNNGCRRGDRCDLCKRKKAFASSFLETRTWADLIFIHFLIIFSVYFKVIKCNAV